MKRLSASRIKSFRKQVYTYYRAHKRDLPWRQTHDPYTILVSEVMLQQTQVSRGLIKYPQFLAAFPTVGSLAQAPLKRVLQVWQGLGYNRRALMLRRAAQAITKHHSGIFPRTYSELVDLPGVGPATAAGILNFAFGKPTSYLETNVRTVYLHHFFPGRMSVHDKELIPLIEQTIDTKNPREWFYALLDYGVHLKKLHKNPSRRSAHYTKQSAFEGSKRQKRARTLRKALKAGASEQRLLRLLE